jgi:hypothetical protein
MDFYRVLFTSVSQFYKLALVGSAFAILNTDPESAKENPEHWLKDTMPGEVCSRPTARCFLLEDRGYLLAHPGKGSA